MRPVTFKFEVSSCTFLLIFRVEPLFFYLKGKLNAAVYVFSLVHPFPEVCRPRKLVILYPWGASYLPRDRIFATL